MPTNDKRSVPTRKTDRRKSSETHGGPADQREKGSVQYVLLYAPPDADWEVVAEVYQKGIDPKEAWPNAE